MAGYVNRKGEQIDVAEWARLYDDFEGYRRILETPLPDGGKVITIWSGVVSPVIEGLYFTAVLDRTGHVIQEVPTMDEDAARAAHATTVETRRGHAAQV